MIAALLLFLAAPCRDCHPDQDDAWRESRHAIAATNPLFLASFQAEPMHWCLECHAPSGDRGEGVGCTACHSGHERTRAGAVERCGTCHQFNFPIGKSEPVHMSDHPMQNTLAEWRASAAAREGRSCVSCHLEGGDHRMRGGHDVALLSRTIAITAARIEYGEVRIELVANGAGHEVPTGDPFRRLAVAICADPECSMELERRELGRTFIEGGGTWTMVRDDALEPGVPRRLEFKVRGGDARPLFFCLSIAYAARGTETSLPPEAREAVIRCGEVAQRR